MEAIIHDSAFIGLMYRLSASFLLKCHHIIITLIQIFNKLFHIIKHRLGNLNISPHYCPTGFKNHGGKFLFVFLLHFFSISESQFAFFTSQKCKAYSCPFFQIADSGQSIQRSVSDLFPTLHSFLPKI